MNKNEYSMLFTNKEIIEYLIRPLKKFTNMTIRMSSSEDAELFEDSIERISFVSFDGERENFSISFYGYQTSIFISDEDLTPQHKYTFNEEFMFIDDDMKHKYTLSDTYKNIVYEGKLKNKTHREILDMFYKIIVLLNGSKKIYVQEKVITKEDFTYPISDYTVRIYNDLNIKKETKVENILFIVNGDV